MDPVLKKGHGERLVFLLASYQLEKEELGSWGGSKVYTKP